MGSYFTQGLISNLTGTDNNAFKLNVPSYRQEHSLSCEVAALHMVLDYYGVGVSENELLAKLPFDTFAPRNVKDNIWGNPENGFVGNIDGRIPNGGYGVYEKPIADLASRFRQSKALAGANLSDILQEIQNGHPAIVWGSVSTGKDISWSTLDGEKIQAVLGEHTRVLYGYKGSVDNPSVVYMMDPIYGAIKMSKDNFLKNWALLDNKAVIVY
jgi:uncharacterized protein YvpB